MFQSLMTRPPTHVTADLAEICDGCGAAAKVRASLSAGGELSFCGHHANLYAQRLVELSSSVAVESGFSWRGAA